MTVASLAETKAKFSAYLQQAEATGHVVVTRKVRAGAKYTNNSGNKQERPNLPNQPASGIGLKRPNR